mgnify:CR=1 FL=1
MIATMLRIQWTNLRRDRIALVLTFLLPLLFFSVFAIIFRGLGNTTRPIRVALIDEDESALTRRLVEILQADPSLDTQFAAKAAGADGSLNRDTASALVKNGDVPVAVVFPQGLANTFPDFSGRGPAVEILADSSDPIAARLIAGLLQKAAMLALGDRLPFRLGGLTGGTTDGSINGLMATTTIDLLGHDKQAPLVSFYAAATAVMFVLSSAANAGGSLLEESESGTLERLLSSSLGMNRLLIAKWLHLTIVGVLQLSLMFLFGSLVFHVTIWDRIVGLSAMSIATAAAASSFGLLLASLCRSRGQLSGISTVLVLSMSAVGGSMFPRYLMSETMQKVGLLTFNGWALDGFIKVLWRDAPITELVPQLAVLLLLAVFLAIAARGFSRRWEAS